MKLKHISRREVERLPNTSDDSAALKMYMLAEISRNEHDEAGHDALIAQMVQRFPNSRWLEEALYSGGNMYLLKHDAKQATYHYSLLVKMFPNSTYAASAHWRAAWMNYRLHNYAEAARLMDEQIQGYSAGIEVPSALYWRGRIYEEQEHNFAQAANYYRALTASYVNYYYALLARQRLNVLKAQAATAAPAAVLSAVPKPAVPTLTGELPENEPHLIKARLLANAALNEYIGPEIQRVLLRVNGDALAQAEIFTSYGETTRALQAMKHSGISFFAMPLDQVPTVYWKVLFPQPYWSDLVANSQKNGLDPYLVASLIRQESEFNAGVVSHANAWGLMQLLPSVGQVDGEEGRAEGIQHEPTAESDGESATWDQKSAAWCWTGLAASQSMRWLLITRGMCRCGSGWRRGAIRISRSLSSRFLIPRRASMFRRSCATGRFTARCMPLSDEEPSERLLHKMRD